MGEKLKDGERLWRVQEDKRTIEKMLLKLALDQDYQARLLDF